MQMFDNEVSNDKLLYGTLFDQPPGTVPADLTNLKA